MTPEVRDWVLAFHPRKIAVTDGDLWTTDMYNTNIAIANEGDEGTRGRPYVKEQRWSAIWQGYLLHCTLWRFFGYEPLSKIDPKGRPAGGDIDHTLGGTKVDWKRAVEHHGFVTFRHKVEHDPETLIIGYEVVRWSPTLTFLELQGAAWGQEFLDHGVVPPTYRRTPELNLMLPWRYGL